MGGCASRPKVTDPDELPDENQAITEQAPQSDGGDPTVENKKDVESKSKEDPLVDLSDPKPDAPSADGEPRATTDLVSENGRSKLESGESEKFLDVGLEAVDLNSESLK